MSLLVATFGRRTRQQAQFTYPNTQLGWDRTNLAVAASFSPPGGLRVSCSHLHRPSQGITMRDNWLGSSKHVYTTIVRVGRHRGEVVGGFIGSGGTSCSEGRTGWPPLRPKGAHMDKWWRGPYLRDRSKDSETCKLGGARRIASGPRLDGLFSRLRCCVFLDRIVSCHYSASH